MESPCRSRHCVSISQKHKRGGVLFAPVRLNAAQAKPDALLGIPAGPSRRASRNHGHGDTERKKRAFLGNNAETKMKQDIAELVLRTIDAKHREARAATPPPLWLPLRSEEHRDAVAMGPRYSPQWFGDLAADNAGRVRLLRTVHELVDAGFISATFSDGGRLQRVKLSEAGEAAVAELNRQGAT